MTRDRPLRVALVGLGPIGLELGRALLSRQDVAIAAAVDRAPALAGRALAALLPGAPEDILVDASLAAALGRSVEAVVLATSSRLVAVRADLEAAVAAGVHLVSTCEELAAPGVDPVAWAAIDAAARTAGVTLLGVGVNPGFVMDRLVLQLAQACVSVDRVQVERIVDAGRRRPPLRRKVGEGLTPAEFAAGVKAGRIGHVGLRESAALVAAGLGWTIERYLERIDPVIGVEGRCLGLRQLGEAVAVGERRISLHLEMWVGASDPHDRVVLSGDPPIDARIAGGIHGDRGTVGATVQALLRLPSAPRGLVTVADVFV